ncbi:MAG: nucleotide exchange factor GrpE, partial [Rhodomicrobium sp.]
LLKWGRIVRKLQMKNTPAAQNEEGAATGEQNELENLYVALNALLAENKSLEEKNLELQEELNALRLRSDRDNQESMKYAISEFAADMICVADNVHRAIEAVPKEQLSAIPAMNSLVEGFEVTERSLLTALNRYGVTRFDPLGEPFNPHLHEAKSTVSAPDLPGNTVVQVIQVGFMIGERLLRPAGVVVAQAGAGSRRYAQEADASERSSSVLHKPVITAAEGVPRERAANISNYIRASDQNRPSLPDQAAAYETKEISPASDPAKAIEDAQERAQAVNGAFEAKNYAEAARLQERIAAEVCRTEIAAEGKPGDGTLDALLSLSWYQLFAGQYDTVIATADQAAAISEGYISIDTNRAHALMLKGSTDEARVVYNKHKGKETRNKKIWDNEVLDDFDELEQEDIKHPLMNEIRSAWAAESGTWPVI